MNTVLCFPNQGTIVAQNVRIKEKECPCCGKKYYISPLIEQSLCNACYEVSVKMLFSGDYDNLTAAEFRNAVREKIRKGEDL